MLSTTKKTVYLIILFIFCSLSFLHAQNDPTVKWKDGKKYYVHKIQKGETWSGLSRDYKASIKDLQKINPKAKELKFDQVILIPYDLYQKSNKSTAEANSEDVKNPKSEVVKSNTTTSKGDTLSSTKSKEKPKEIKKEASNEKKKVEPTKKVVTSNLKSQLPDTIKAYKNTPKTHVVKAGETLYGIAAKYHMNFQDFAKLNSLTSTTIKIGQVLKIPQYIKIVHFADSTKAPEPLVDTNKVLPKAIVKEVRDSLVLSPDDTLAPDSLKLVAGPNYWLLNPYEKFYFNNTAESGVATWMLEGSLNKKEKFYALHRTAPIGTIIKVVNPMNKRFVFVKVVGPLPDTGDNHDVLIKITQSAARRIGIVDARFRVDISYGLKGKPTPSKR